MDGYGTSSTIIHLRVVLIGSLAIRVRDGLVQHALSVRPLLRNHVDKGVSEYARHLKATRENVLAKFVKS